MKHVLNLMRGDLHVSSGTDDSIGEAFVPRSRHMKKKVLLIDDTRLPSWIPNGVDPITRWPIHFSDEEVEIARNAEDGLKALTENGPWHLLLLDHDLGEEKTGYDVLTFLEENTHYLPPVIYLVTSNPVGGKRMLQILISLKEKGLVRSYGWIHASGGTP